MLTLDTVTAAIVSSLPLFGLRIARAEASCIATLYVYQRPQRSAEDVAAMLVNVHGLPWRTDDDHEIQQLVMRLLVDYLDMQYFVATQEHDANDGGLSAHSNR